MVAFLPGEIKCGNISECEKDSVVTMLRKYDRSGTRERERENAHVLKYSCVSSLEISVKLCIKGNMGKWSLFVFLFFKKKENIYIIQLSTFGLLF